MEGTKENNFFLDKKEQKFLFWVILVLLIFINCNYIYGWLQNNSQVYFQGFLVNLEDSFQYLSLMRQAREGHFLFTFLYSVEEIPARVFQPFFLFLGMFSSIFPPLFVYHLARNVLSIILVILLYVFIGYFIENISYRRWTLVFLIFTSGWAYYYHLVSFFVPSAWMGWFQWFRPAELFAQDSSLFFMFYLFPHLLAALILMVFILFFLLHYIEYGERKKLLCAGALTFLLGFFHLYDVITIYAVSFSVFLWMFVRTRNWRAFVLHPMFFYLLSLPPMAYQYWVVTQYPEYRLLALSTYSPIHFFGFLLTMGIFSFFTLWFFWKWIRVGNKFPLKYEKRWKFLAIWILVNVPLVLYGPFPQHRRLILGLQIPIVILGSMVFFYYLLPKMKTWRMLRNEFIPLRPKTPRLAAGMRAEGDVPKSRDPAGRREAGATGDEDGKKLLRYPAVLPQGDFIFGIAVMVLLLHAWSPLTIFFRDMMEIKNHTSYFFSEDFYKDLLDIDALNIHGTILSSYSASRLIPHFTGNRVYQGHWANTLFLLQKRNDYKLFFSSESSNVFREDFLKKYKISYILPTGKEREALASFQMQGIEKIYSGRTSNLYKVFYDLHAN